MNRTNFELYAVLEKQRRAIEAQQTELKAILMSEMGAEDKTTVKSEFGSFVICPVHTAWQFSPAVSELMKQVDDRKAEEKAKKIATKTITMGVKFTPVKETNDNA